MQKPSSTLGRRMDKNDDGKISSDEAQGQLKKNFDRVDTNDDGLIDRGELENLAERLQRNRAGSALKGEIVTLPDKIRSQAESLDPSFVIYTQIKIVDGKKAPLIIFLHGGGGTRRKIEDFLWNNQAKSVNQKPIILTIVEGKGHGIGSVHNDTKLYDWFLKQSLD